MLNIVVTAQATSGWQYLPNDFGDSIPEGQTTDNYILPFMMNGGDMVVPAANLSVQKGYLQQGKDSFGTERDKEVTHLNISGDIEISGTKLHYGVTSGGHLIAKTTTGTTIPVARFIHWGDPVNESRTAVAWREFIPSYGKWLVHGALHRTTWFVYDGDRAMRITRTQTDRSYWEATGVTQAAGSIGWMRTCLYRNPSTKRIYAWGTGIQDTSGSGEPSVAALWLTWAQGSTMLSLKYLLAEVLLDPLTYAEQLAFRIERDHMQHLLLEEHPADFGDLALECAKQLRYVDKNILGLVFDVNSWIHFRNLWKSLRNEEGWRLFRRAFQAFLRGELSKKELIDLLRPGSNTFLFGKYAVQPAVSDCKRLLGGLRYYSGYLHKQRLHSRKITQISDPTSAYNEHCAVITIQCDEYPTSITGRLQKFFGELKKWGLRPETVNLWDLLIYSFVIDWFISIGDTLEDIDEYTYMENRFPVDYVVCSEKWTVGKDINTMYPDLTVTASGTVDFSYYVRWCSREVPLPTVSTPSVSLTNIHWLELGALIVQRL